MELCLINLCLIFLGIFEYLNISIIGSSVNMSKTSHCEAYTSFLFLVTLAKSGNPKMTSKQISYFLFFVWMKFCWAKYAKKTYLPYWGVDCRWKHVRVITSNQPIFALIAYFFGDFVFLLLIVNLLKVIFWIFKSQLINTLGDTGPSTLDDKISKHK